MVRVHAGQFFEKLINRLIGIFPSGLNDHSVSLFKNLIMFLLAPLFCMGLCIFSVWKLQVLDFPKVNLES